MVVIPERFRSMERFSDEQILDLVLQGQVELYELLMRRYNQRLFRVARSILKNESEAEDVMQEAYVRAYVNLAGFRGESSFATWLTRIAVHEALARAKRRGLVESFDDDEMGSAREMSLPSSRSDPEQVAAGSELKAAIEAAIDALPVLYRSAFVLRYVEGLSIREAARSLEITEEALKMRTLRARVLMKRHFKERFRFVSGQLFPLHLSICDRVVTGTYRRLLAAGAIAGSHA